jgi:two-component system cell cycle response regulator
MGARILVIEDNPANLELMRYVLGAFGHTVVTAIDGDEGIAAARRERPDLIVCDLQLPGIDGFEVVRRLNADPAFARVPLIAVTAYAMVGDRERVLAAGFDDYIAKPIEPQSFVDRVDGFLRSEKRRAPAPRRAPAQSLQGAAPAAASNGKYVLVLDDTRANIELLRSILGSAGYEIGAAQNLAQACELALARRPDLILSDFHLRNESGMDFIAWVKAQPALAGLPFVFISSTVRAEADRRAGLERGADRFILRPIEAPALLDQLAACLARSAAAA